MLMLSLVIQVKLRSSDEQMFEVPEDVALESQMIKNMVEVRPQVLLPTLLPTGYLLSRPTIKAGFYRTLGRSPRFRFPT